MTENQFRLAVIDMAKFGVFTPQLKAEVQRRMGEHGNRCPMCKKKREAYKGIVHEATGKVVRKTYRCDPCDFEWDINRRDKDYDFMIKSGAN